MKDAEGTRCFAFIAYDNFESSDAAISNMNGQFFAGLFFYLFYFIFILFYFILFYFILFIFNFILFYFIFILFYFIFILFLNFILFKSKTQVVQ